MQNRGKLNILILIAYKIINQVPVKLQLIHGVNQYNYIYVNNV